VALLLTIAGCAQSVPGTAGPVAAQLPAGGLPLEPDEQAAVALFAEVRTWDMCALHDIPAAASVTGYVPDEILPYAGLGSCRLTLQQPDGVSDWDLTFEVSRTRPADGGAPITIGGTQLPQVGYQSTMECAYSYPVGPPDAEWGIELTASNVSPNRPQCDVARDYLNAVAQRLAAPPLRSAGATTPALSLPGVDPCSVAAQLVPVVANGAAVPREDLRADMDTPYECFVGVEIGTGTPQAEDVRSTVEFTVDSTVLDGGGTVAGRPAVIQQRAASTAPRRSRRATCGCRAIPDSSRPTRP
jgi:hypothetical protein